MTDNNAQLGLLEQVDLKNVWNNEPKEFTPWLAKSENLQLLGDAVGIELELEAQEKNVGPFQVKETYDSHELRTEVVLDDNNSKTYYE